MNKFTKFLIVLSMVLLVLYIILSNYNIKQNDISSKVGAKLGGGELTMREYYTLAQCIETYTKYLNEEDYETAYNMLGTTYRNYVSYEEYASKVQEEDVTDMEIKDIDVISATTFKVVGDVSGDEKYYSIIVDNDLNRFSIYPESFLNYTEINQKVSKKKLDVRLIDAKVTIDKCIMQFEFTNNSPKDTVKFSKMSLLTTSLRNF